MLGQSLVLAGFVLIFLWGWRRVYLHVIRKKGRPLIAHMLGLLLALFPARFFVYAAFAMAPMDGAEPVPASKALLLASLCVVSIVALHILTRPRTQKALSLPEPDNASPQQDESGKAGNP